MTFKAEIKDTYQDQIVYVADLIEEAEAIALGIGAGMSSASGFTYVGDRFKDNFPDFIEKHNFFDLLQAFIYPYEDPREYWAFWSRHALLNYYDEGIGQTYEDLKDIIDGKDWFAITTNMDSAFARSGYPDYQVLHYHGRADIWQCSKLCNGHRFYNNEGTIREMVDKQENMLIPEDLVPYCPECGAPMHVNKRTDEDGMVEDYEFKLIEKNYHGFIDKSRQKKTVYLEIGVGNTRPEFIKHPFQEETEKNKDGVYLLLNHKNYRIPPEIRNQTIQMKEDIASVLKDLAEELKSRKEN